MPRWNDTIHHSTNTATADACMQGFCTQAQCSALVMQSETRSVLTTIKPRQHAQ